MMKATLEDMELMSQIANRAMELYPGARDKISWMMDLETVHERVGLRLADLLAADNGNFGHDIVGIANNLDRDTGELENCFHPRYAA